MDSIISLYGRLAENYGHWGLALMLAAITVLAVQLYYYLGPYARLVRYRTPQGRRAQDGEGVSVIVLLGDNEWYLENTLPKLMGQDHPRFEVVIVAIAPTEDFTGLLSIMKMRYPNLVTTHMDSDPRFPISNKMAYNVGIKAASYEHIILTTSDAVPVSPKCLAAMDKGFAAGDVVLGYCGIEKRDEAANKFMRSSRLMLSVRYLSAAVKGHPYRGMIHNLGFTRRTYFEHKGFGYLNMNLGEDDLFIQNIAVPGNTGVVMNPHATLRQTQWGDMSWWRQRRRFYNAARPYYKRWAKNYEQWELGSRLLFYITVIAMIAVMPLEVKIGAAVLWLGRLSLVRYKMWRVRRRLGEGGIGWALMWYDMAEPFTRIALAVGSRLKPAPGVWR